MSLVSEVVMEAVFTAGGGAPLRNSNFRRRVWAPAIRAAGLPESVRIHDMRHTCVSLTSFSEGANPKHIQRHLGHSSISVTMDTYGHLFPEDLEYIAERLDARIRRLDDGRRRPGARKRATSIRPPEERSL